MLAQKQEMPELGAILMFSIGGFTYVCKAPPVNRLVSSSDSVIQVRCLGSKEPVTLRRVWGENRFFLSCA